MTTEAPELEKSVFTEHFSTLKDPRRINKGNIKYSLEELIFLTLSAVISGFQTYELIEGFGEERIDWLRKFYPYKFGIPSHDTLGEFFSRLKPKEFAKCLIEFTKTLAQHDSKVIALDGKTVKGFLTSDGYPLHILTAFCTKNKMSLGEETVAGKENEITAIPRIGETNLRLSPQIWVDWRRFVSHYYFSNILFFSYKPSKRLHSQGSLIAILNVKL